MVGLLLSLKTTNDFFRFPPLLGPKKIRAARRADRCLLLEPRPSARVTGVLARIAAGRRRCVLSLARGDQGLLWVPLAQSSGGVLGVALYTEPGCCAGGRDSRGPGHQRAGPRGRSWGGSLALLLAWVALWVRPTERGALAHVVGDADLGTPAPWARAILGGRERVSALNAPSRAVWRGKEAPLALWLHGFYATHAAPYPLTVAYLHKLSGSQTKQVWKFKQNLTKALRDLEAIGAIEAFEIVGDLVHVRTVPSPSQQRHLAARRPPARRRK